MPVGANMFLVAVLCALGANRASAVQKRIFLQSKACDAKIEGYHSFIFALVTVLTHHNIHCRISAKFSWCTSKSRAVFRLVSGLYTMSECYVSF